MPEFEKTEKNIILADLVSSWASEYRLLEHPYIEGLLRTLKSKRNMTMWANMSHVNLLPEPLNLKNVPLQRAMKSLAAIRNIFILFPLAYTWLAIGKASSSFQAFIQQNSSPTANFLDFWQNGYGLLSDNWRFSTMAILDSIIVFLIIILTLTIQQVSFRADRLREKEQLKIDRERLEMAWAVSDYFEGKQSELNQKLNSDLIKAIEELTEASGNLGKSKARKVK
jgi:hypothetical protein